MRETCARVLAAALMTGAIAFAVGMPALFGTARDLGRSVIAPPSSLQRTIHAQAFSAPSLRGAPERAAGTSSLAEAQRPSLARSDQQLSRSRPRPGGKPAPTPTPKPAPQPKPEPTPGAQVGARELASTSAPPTSAGEQGATSHAAARDTQQVHPTKPKGKGKGRAKGHDEDNGDRPAPPAETAQPTSTTTSPPAAAAPAPTSDEPQSDGPATHDDGKGQGNGHGDNGGGEDNGHDGSHGNGNGQAQGHKG
jgi:hypothetical protein